MRQLAQRDADLCTFPIPQSFEGHLAARQLVLTKNQRKAGTTGIGLFELRLHAAHPLPCAGMHLG